MTELQIGGGLMAEKDAQNILDQWKEIAGSWTEAEKAARRARLLAQFRGTYGVTSVSMFPKG